MRGPKYQALDDVLIEGSHGGPAAEAHVIIVLRSLRGPRYVVRWATINPGGPTFTVSERQIVRQLSTMNERLDRLRDDG